MRPGLLGVMAAALLAACPGPRTRSDRPPSTAVQAWLDAVVRDDPRGAYDLLAAPVRKDMTYEVFARRWQESRPERERQVSALTAALKEDPRLGERGKLFLTDGKVVAMIHEPGGWRIEAPLLSSARAATPQDALRLLIAAIESHSYEGVLRLLTSTRREGLRDVTEAFVTGLKANIGQGIEVRGDRATIQWSDGKRRWKVTLKKENGEWRIDDLASP
jgi:hypothetical protein